MRLDQFQLGVVYEVGTSLGALLLCEGWAEPVVEDAHARTPAGETARARIAHQGVAADRNRRER